MIDVDLLKKFAPIQSRTDTRDYKLKKKRVPIRESMDLRGFVSQINEDPQLLNVANAITTSYEIQLKHYYPDTYVDLSSLFVYYNGRYLEGTVNNDISTSVRSGIRGVYYYGICTEALWPYNIDNLNVSPPPEAYEDAKYRYILEYYSLTDIADCVDAIASYKPPVVNLQIFSDFLALDKINNRIQNPQFASQYFGIHSVILVGYNLKDRYFIAKSNFGSQWGDNGYAYLPFYYYQTYMTESWAFTISDQSSSLI